MSSQKPPAVATWLLEHLIVGPNKEAVVGDLFEQFIRRPSSVWYWRQAFAAIVLSVWKKRYMLWLAAAGTLVWIVVFSQLRVYWRFFRFMHSDHFFMAFPWAIHILPLVVVLCVYLLTTDFSLRKLRRGLLVGLLVLFLSLSPVSLVFIEWVPIRTIVAYVVQHPIARPFFIVYINMVGSLPLFIALVFSIWAASTVVEQREKSSDKSVLG